MSDENDQYWYNFTTHAVERGMQSPAIDRAGPFATAEEAEKAPEILRKRSRAWAAEEAKDDDWGHTADTAPDTDGQ